MLAAPRQRDYNRKPTPKLVRPQTLAMEATST
jgi:hypothetical protein